MRITGLLGDGLTSYIIPYRIETRLLLFLRTNNTNVTTNTEMVKLEIKGIVHQKMAVL